MFTAYVVSASTPSARSIDVCQRWAARATTSQRTLCARSAWSGCTRARRSATSPVVAVLVMNEPYVPDVAWSSQWFPFALGSVDAVRSSRSVRTCGSSTATPASTRASARNARPQPLSFARYCSKSARAAAATLGVVTCGASVTFVFGTGALALPAAARAASTNAFWPMSVGAPLASNRLVSPGLPLLFTQAKA